MDQDDAPIRPIAIYLPQFHPIPENDAWWGKGFTEWRNVAKARPLFSGHYQPHLPADLGFYDLRLPEIREEQARLARDHGIHGFCYYHYWFDGKRLLDRPFQEVFESGSPDFPFMLAWANENWTRAWSGDEREVLIAQNYGPEDHRAHVRSLIPYFKDPRYIRVGDKPVFAIYRDDHVDDLREMVRIFREEARAHDLELYLCRFDLRFGTHLGPPEDHGLDAAIDFQPLSKYFLDYLRDRNRSLGAKMRNVVRKTLHRLVETFPILARTPARNALDRRFDMEDFVAYDIARTPETYTQFPGVSPMWDNAARRTAGGATIFVNSSPELFGRWVDHKVAGFDPPSAEENFLFVNAWNEWAEGNHLEPCAKYEDRFLKAFAKGFASGLEKWRARRGDGS